MSIHITVRYWVVFNWRRYTSTGAYVISHNWCGTADKPTNAYACQCAVLARQKCSQTRVSWAITEYLQSLMENNNWVPSRGDGHLEPYACTRVCKFFVFYSGRNVRKRLRRRGVLDTAAPPNRSRRLAVLCGRDTNYELGYRFFGNRSHNTNVSPEYQWFLN